MTGDESRTEDETPDAYPTIPAERLTSTGWSLRDTRTEIRARVAGFVVTAHERRYEDDRLRDAVSEAGGPDHLWRLFYATRLSFSPPLPPVVGPTLALPTVKRAARETFAEVLRAEGLTDVQQREDEPFENDFGQRATRTRYTATLPVETALDRCDVPMEAWIAIWQHGSVLLAGGLYPNEPLEDVLDLPGCEFDPTASREELQSLIAHVDR